MRGLCGEIKLTLHYGRDPARDQRWCCPLLEAWGVRAHQQFTPAARRRLAFTVSANGTYAEAAELATEWGVAVDDSTLHALVQSGGARAEEQTVQRLEKPPEPAPERAPSQLAVLMVDGYCGPGCTPRNPAWPGTNSSWASAVAQEQATQITGGRGLLSGKRLVS